MQLFFHRLLKGVLNTMLKQNTTIFNFFSVLIDAWKYLKRIGLYIYFYFNYDYLIRKTLKIYAKCFIVFKYRKLINRCIKDGNV